MFPSGALDRAIERVQVEKERLEAIANSRVPPRDASR
jgi:hypothetical protein